MSEPLRDAAPALTGPALPALAGDPLPEGLPRRFGANVAVNYALEGITAITSLVVTPVLLARLGEAAFGVWVLAGSVILYLELFELGFGAATVKLVAEDAGQRTEAVLRTLNTSFFVLLGFGLLALASGLALAALAPWLFNVPDALAGETRMVFAILAVSLAISIPCDTFGGGLAGYQRYDLLSLSNLGLSLASAAAAVAVVLAGGNLVTLALVTALLQGASHVLRWRLLARLVPGLRLRPGLVERGRLRSTAGQSGWFLLRDLAVVLVERVDLVVVSVALGVEQAAVYAIGLKLAQLVQRALEPLTVVFFPHASALASQRDERRLGALLLDGTRTAMLAGLPLTLVLLALAGPAVHAWVGPGYGSAAAVVLLLGAARGLTSVSETPRWLLAGAGRIRAIALVAVTEGMVNLALSVLLVRVIQPAGVALATLLGVAGVSLPAALALALRHTGVPARVFLRRALLPHLAPALVTGAALALGRPLLPAGSLLVVPAAGLAVLLYGLTYYLVGATAGEREQVRRLARLVPALRGGP